MTTVDRNAIWNTDGELCVGPLLDTLEALCAENTDLREQLNAISTTGAVLIDGSTQIQGCLSYANGITCSTPSSIPTWGQVEDAIDANEDITCSDIGSTVSGGAVPVPPGGKVLSASLVAPVPAGIVGITATGQLLGAPIDGDIVNVRWVQEA